jgi:hypothetical protein
MPGNDRKFWWCGGKDGCGHVVGEIGYKDLQAGDRMTGLLVYETSLDTPPKDMPKDRGLMVTGFGYSCTLCPNTYDWYPSLASLRKLLSRYGVSHETI